MVKKEEVENYKNRKENKRQTKNGWEKADFPNYQNWDLNLKLSQMITIQCISKNQSPSNPRWWHINFKFAIKY